MSRAIPFSWCNFSIAAQAVAAKTINKILLLKKLKQGSLNNFKLGFFFHNWKLTELFWFKNCIYCRHCTKSRNHATSGLKCCNANRWRCCIARLINLRDSSKIWWFMGGGENFCFMLYSPSPIPLKGVSISIFKLVFFWPFMTLKAHLFQCIG